MLIMRHSVVVGLVCKSDVHTQVLVLGQTFMPPLVKIGWPFHIRCMLANPCQSLVNDTTLDGRVEKEIWVCQHLLRVCATAAVYVLPPLDLADSKRMYAVRLMSNTSRPGVSLSQMATKL